MLILIIEIEYKKKKQSIHQHKESPRVLLLNVRQALIFFHLYLSEKKKTK